MTDRPWFGLHLPNYTFADTPPEFLFDRIIAQARTAEAAGFDLREIPATPEKIMAAASAREPQTSLQGKRSSPQRTRRTRRTRR